MQFFKCGTCYLNAEIVEKVEDNGDGTVTLVTSFGSYPLSGDDATAALAFVTGACCKPPAQAKPKEPLVPVKQ